MSVYLFCMSQLLFTLAPLHYRSTCYHATYNEYIWFGDMPQHLTQIRRHDHSERFPLQIAFSKCEFQFNFLTRVSPKYTASSVNEILTPRKQQRLRVFSFFFLVKDTTTILWGLMGRPSLSHQNLIVVKRNFYIIFSDSLDDNYQIISICLQFNLIQWQFYE